MGRGYFVAEDSAGKRIAELGHLPLLRVKQFQPELITAGGVHFDSSTDSLHPPMPAALSASRQYTSREAAYEDYVANYSTYFINIVPRAAVPMKNMEKFVDESGGGASGIELWQAAGVKPKRWTQIRPNEAYSEWSFASGCGGTAISNLIAWWDVNWTPSLLQGPTLPLGAWFKTGYTEGYMASIIKYMFFYLVTFESPVAPGQGATWPWRMTEGMERWGTQHNNYLDWAYSYDITPGGDPEAAQIARGAIQYYRKPAIIGYWDDYHYDLAYKYRDADSKGYFFIDKDDEDGEWVRYDDVFYAAVIYDVSPNSNRLRNYSFESGWSRWNAEGPGNIVSAGDAYRGTMYYRMGSSSGGTQRLWQSFMVQTESTATYSFSAWVQTTSNVQVKVRYRQGQLGALGPVVKEQTFPASVGDWTKIQMSLPRSTWPTMAMEILSVAPNGQNSSTSVDNLIVKYTGPNQPPTPEHIPCVPPKFTDGCGNPDDY
jgi:hypothetical protein